MLIYDNESTPQSLISDQALIHNWLQQANQPRPLSIVITQISLAENKVNLNLKDQRFSVLHERLIVSCPFGLEFLCKKRSWIMWVVSLVTYLFNIRKV